MIRKRDSRIRRWKTIRELNKEIGTTRLGAACSAVADFVRESSWVKHCPIFGVCRQLYKVRLF
jgi:hypothetical protein